MSLLARPGIILDRDGTLIDVVRDEETGTVSVAFHPSQVRLLPGVVEGLTELAAAGFGFAIATNQPGPAKGQYSVQAVERTNSALLELLAQAQIEIASVEVCLHHPVGAPAGDAQWVGGCACRKPKPGLLLHAIEHAHFDPARSWMIGDSATDVLAARAAGLRAALVFPTNRCEICPLRSGPSVGADLVAARFDELARAILRA
ncbi:MAG TPA: HAD-IIIA family hydrolase [Polyangiaceae bacterium]|jgi:D-glycero-D-manno-heptose 1,7-bisphosphate phosphatase|nr:HAD-IIIA family hydrolase [Polyangiaceae bacterium]